MHLFSNAVQNTSIIVFVSVIDILIFSCLIGTNFVKKKNNKIDGILS